MVLSTLFFLTSLLVSTSPALARQSNIRAHRAAARANHHQLDSHLVDRSGSHNFGLYKLADCHQGRTFFDGWTFDNIPDPTHGYVNYTDAATAKALGLAYVNEGRAVMKVDSKTDFPANTTNPLRNSVRMFSTKAYNGGLFVLDAKNFPYGCSVWPAFWMFGPDWPNNGELDIYEGVNKNTNNQYTAHTAANCTLDTNPPPAFRVSNDTSTVGLTNCKGGSGCYYVDNTVGTYGPDLNAAGGAVLATLWTDDGLRIWRFPRHRVPLDLLAEMPNPSSWPQEDLVASWASPTCPTKQYFNDMNMVFDITLCGDWAGAPTVWAASGCPGTCVNTVLTGSNFVNAVWEVNYVKVFQPL